MNIFITGTDTDVGKTTISKWLCYHFGYSYFKPIQTGSMETTDSSILAHFSPYPIYPSQVKLKAPLCPYHAAILEESFIDLPIRLPECEKLIVEGAGGVLVPIRESYLMIDLMGDLNLGVIVVARSSLGTLNHTLLTLEALRARNISVLGLILNGPKNEMNKQTLEALGQTLVVDELELMSDEKLKTRVPSARLQALMGCYAKH